MLCGRREGKKERRKGERSNTEYVSGAYTSLSDTPQNRSPPFLWPSPHLRPFPTVSRAVASFVKVGVQPQLPRLPQGPAKLGMDEGQGPGWVQPQGVQGLRRPSLRWQVRPLGPNQGLPLPLGLGAVSSEPTRNPMQKGIVFLQPRKKSPTAPNTGSGVRQVPW